MAAIKLTSLIIKLIPRPPGWNDANAIITSTKQVTNTRFFFILPWVPIKEKIIKKTNKGSLGINKLPPLQMIASTNKTIANLF